MKHASTPVVRVLERTQDVVTSNIIFTSNIFFQAPPGIKKNLLRSYDTWSPEFISKDNNVTRAQALFALAWFHAVCQERRNFIPQGWTKFYEFSLSDLRAGADIIDRLCDGKGNILF